MRHKCAENGDDHRIEIASDGKWYLNRHWAISFCPYCSVKLEKPELRTETIGGHREKIQRARIVYLQEVERAARRGFGKLDPVWCYRNTAKEMRKDGWQTWPDRLDALADALEKLEPPKIEVSRATLKRLRDMANKLFDQIALPADDTIAWDMGTILSRLLDD